MTLETDKILRKTDLAIFIKKNIHIHFDPAILHREKCPKEINAPIQKGICITMFTVALFIVAKGPLREE